jgi:hypothetical protein
VQEIVLSTHEGKVCCAVCTSVFTAWPLGLRRSAASKVSEPRPVGPQLRSFSLQSHISDLSAAVHFGKLQERGFTGDGDRR